MHDAVSAGLAEAAGFSALTCGGYAATASLLGAPDDERLVQIKIRGIAAQGDQERLHTVIADLKVRAWYRYGETELHPSTNAVVSELLEGLEGLRA